MGFRLLSLLSEFAGCGFKLSLGALTPSVVLSQWRVTGRLAVCLLVPGDVLALQLPFDWCLHGSSFTLLLSTYRWRDTQSVSWSWHYSHVPRDRVSASGGPRV